MSFSFIDSIRQINIAAKNLIDKKALIVNNNVNIVGTIKANSNTEIVPIGYIVAYPGASAPPGWAICNGTQGTPDLRGRCVIGPSGGRGYNTSGGKEKETISVEQMPSHSHTTSTNGAHTHTFNYGNQGSDRVGGGGVPICDVPSSIDKSASHSHGLNYTGSNQPHENMQPYIALNYIMRIK